MTARQVAMRLTVVLDSLGFLALAATWEVSVWILLLTGGIALSATTQSLLARSKNSSAVLFKILLCTFLCGLGAWQLQRLHWKENVLARIEALKTAPALPLVQVLTFRRLPSLRSTPHHTSNSDGYYPYRPGWGHPAWLRAGLVLVPAWQA